jgi:glycosyltransferase involved in cell wall biosynthesis
MKKVISIVLNNFKNDSRVLKENISLQKEGYEVQVVALHEEPLKEYEEIQNISVHRVKLKSRGWSKHKLVQLFKYFEFVYKVIKQYKNSDIIHCNDLDTLPVGVIIKKFFNKKVKIVYDAHEYETERHNQSKIERKLLKFLENFLIKYVDVTITVSNSIAIDYIKLYHINKPYIIFNTPNYRDTNKKNIFRKKFNIDEKNIIFLYQGGLSKGRGILEFINLIKNIQNVSYIIMGYGPLEKEIKEIVKKEKNIYFHDAVSPDILLDYTSSADIGVCIEENICKSWDYALPNKMFEYYMANLPVIVSGLSEMKKFVIENNTGYVIEDIFSRSEFMKIFNEIKNTYKEKINNVLKIKNIYNWEKEEKKLINIYNKL